MKQLSKDPFEVAFVESPPDSPVAANGVEPQIPVASASNVDAQDDYDDDLNPLSNNPSTSASLPSTSIATTAAATGKTKEEEEEEEEENMDVELGKLSSSADPDKMVKMQAILSQFTEEQMSRYESFRRSGFQKSNMKRTVKDILDLVEICSTARASSLQIACLVDALQHTQKLIASITGSPKISLPTTIVVSGIAKMFVGEIVETARMIMTERRENGPIRPCHIREAYRRLKLEGKIPKKSVPRLFR